MAMLDKEGFPFYINRKGEVNLFGAGSDVDPTEFALADLRITANGGLAVMKGTAVSLTVAGREA